MTVSIGVVTNERRRFTHAAQVSALATEMKSYAKTLPGSVYSIDRRTDAPSPRGAGRAIAGVGVDGDRDALPNGEVEVNVSCPECRSVFRVDPAKVPAGGVRARCSVCGGVITVGAGAPIEEEFAPCRAATPVVARPPSRAERSRRAPVPHAAHRPISAADRSAAAGADATPAHRVPATATAGGARRPRPIAVSRRRRSAAAGDARSAPRSGAACGPAAAGASCRTAASRADAVGTVLAAGGLRGAAARRHRRHRRSPRPACTAVRAAARRARASAACAPSAVRRDARRLRPSRRLARRDPRSAAAAQPHAAATRDADRSGSDRRRPAAAPPARRRGGRRPTPTRAPINPFLANDPNAKARRLARALVSDIVDVLSAAARRGTARRNAASSSSAKRSRRATRNTSSRSDASSPSPRRTSRTR